MITRYKSKVMFVIYSWLFLVFLCVIAGCEKKINAMDGVVKDEDVQFSEQIFAHPEREFNNAVDQLVSYRYHIKLSDDVTVDAWNYEGVNDYGWNKELLRLPLLRIVLAEILSKHDKDNYQEYHEFIRSYLDSSDLSERAFSGLSLGLIGDDSDVPLLVEKVIEDEEFSAIQAGFGLIGMKTEESKSGLEFAISELHEINDQRSQNILRSVEAMVEELK